MFQLLMLIRGEVSTSIAGEVISGREVSDLVVVEVWLGGGKVRGGLKQ